jgi:quercetin dioxygenase-like cupin family protein
MRQLLVLLSIALATGATAQVQVSREPRHHKVLDNEWVRVLDVHVPPHDTTMMHKHSTPSVFLVLSNTKTGSEVLVEPGKPSFADGNIWFEGFYDKPRIHRVWNEDTIEFHVMDIEFPHIPAATFTVMDPPASKQLFDAKPVRVYRLTVAPGQHLVLPRSQSPILVVNLSGPAANGTVNRQPVVNKGDYLFLPGNSPLAIGNNGAVEQQFALLYLK